MLRDTDVEQPEELIEPLKGKSLAEDGQPYS